MRLARRPLSEIVIPSWLIGSLLLRSLSWRWGRMKCEKRIMVDGGRVAGRKRGDRFWRLKAPDALPGSIMMPYRGSRWFRRSNCEDTKRDGDRPEMGTHTGTYMQMQAHMHSHVQFPVSNTLLEISQTLTTQCSLLVDFKRGYVNLPLYMVN